MLLDIPPLDPKLPASIEATVLALCKSLRDDVLDGDAENGGEARQLTLLRDSGLLSLAVPAQFGGKGASWGTALDTVRRVAKADSAMGERLACQCLQLATIQWLADGEQQGELLFGTANGDWLWGAAVSSANSHVRAETVAGGFEISGSPGVQVGVAGADRLLLSALLADAPGTVLAAVDCGREGLLHRTERQGATADEVSRVEFRRMHVATRETLGGARTSVPVQATLRPLLEQLGLIHLYLGVCQGAFDDLVLSNRGQRRAALALRGEDSDMAPQMLQRYSDLWVDLKAASVLTRSAARAFEDAAAEGSSLRSAERGRLALEISEARQLASRAGAQITQAVFEVMSAPVARAFRFDSWWRRLRANSLHDPIDFKRREIGRWILCGDLPRATLFS